MDFTVVVSCELCQFSEPRFNKTPPSDPFFIAIAQITNMLINPFVPKAPFLYPLKIFSIFSGSRERVHWEQIS